MARTGRPSKGKSPLPRKTLLTYEELCSRTGDGDTITIQYDGIERSGHWYDDHMMTMFDGCKVIHLFGSTYAVAEWPKKGAWR